MLNLIVVVHYVTLYCCHSFVIYVTDISHLEVLQATTVTIDYYGFAGMGSVIVALVQHVLDS